MINPKFDLNYVGFKFFSIEIFSLFVICLIWTMWDLNKHYLCFPIQK